MNNIDSSPTSERTYLGRKKTWLPLILSASAIIVGVQLFPLFGVQEPTVIENRILAEPPHIPKSIIELEQLPKQLDAFTQDNLPVRKYLISTLNFIRYKLGYSGSSRILVGQNGWLFYDDGNHLGVISGKLKLDSTSVQTWVSGFRQRVNYLDSKNIKFYMMLPPVKEDIYQENRPLWMPKNRITTEIDDIISSTHDAGFTQLIDPRSQIIEQKNRQKLYDEYDTHWTGLGAYIAYNVLMSRVSQDFPDLKPLPLSHFVPTELSPEHIPRDLSLMLGIADFVAHDRISFATYPHHDPSKTIFLSDRQDWTAPQILHTDSKSGKTLLLLRDSFSTELLPLLKEHFTTVIMSHVQDGFFRTDLIEQYRPDIVMLILIETGARHPMYIIPGLERQKNAVE
ncbi:alginate O-acetyltransferase AlgX-related protein [Pseudomonas sp. Ma2-10]